ncbi:MAG: DUF393 domain-containing protein [Verrucomicrobia bacterium]|jgi:predicted DCC family thiol-disulfide oxidoreductase YuxK|nr:DUF393 domain-containing protein [Verrucomicrobiota bacterium]
MRWILFIDSDCALCAGWARRVCRADPQERIFIASLNSEPARQPGLSCEPDNGDATVVLLREPDDARFFRSDALIELGRVLGGAWRWLVLLRAIPRPLRDAAYRLVARHRRRLSRANAACAIDDPVVRSRLIDGPG